MRVIILIISLVIYTGCYIKEKERVKQPLFEYEIVEKSIETDNCIYYIYTKSDNYEKMALLSDSLVRIGGEYNAILFWSEKAKISKINVLGTIPDSVADFVVANYSVDSYDYKYKLFYEEGPLVLENGFVADSSFFVFWRQDSVSIQTPPSLTPTR